MCFLLFLAPCKVTKQHLDARNLLLSDGQRRSELVRNGEIAEFMCRKGYVILSPSVIKCVNGIMDFPSCIASGKFDVNTFPLVYLPEGESSLFSFVSATLLPWDGVPNDVAKPQLWCCGNL